MTDAANSANSVALLNALETPLTVEKRPIPVPAADEIVIENKAVAINPIDLIIYRSGFLVKNFPVILGLDGAGVVVSVGSEAASTYKEGDRVFALTESVFAPKQEKGGFQKYSNVRTLTAGKLPENVSFVDGSTLPLGAFTAAIGLFRSNHLGLDLPQFQKSAPNGKTVLIWGGASSVGANAIQLAVAAGYRVVTTASAKNIDLVKRLGAAEVLDYHKASIVDDAVAVLSGSDFAGTFLAAASGDSFQQAADITKAAKGVEHVSGAPVYPEGFNPDVKVSWVDIGIQNYSEETRNIAHHLFGKFLPDALEAKEFSIFPLPKVLGTGIEKIQDALDTFAAGVSASKLVVEL